MKILKVKIEVTHEGGATQYVGYPKEWLDNKSKISIILYPQDRTDEVMENGKIYHIVYPILPDDVYDLMKGLPICSEPNLDELTTYSDKHMPQITKITDQDKVLSILAKVALDEKLTKEDRDALNPENSARGISKSKRWIDNLKDYGVTNV